MRPILLALAMSSLLITATAHAQEESPQPVGTPALEVRISQMAAEIRALRGQLEQAQYQNAQTANEMKKLSMDVDYRLQTLEQKQMTAAAPAPAAPAAPVAPTAEAATPLPPAPVTSATGKDFPDSNAHYNYAFKLLSDKKYSEAASSFDAFVKKYPSDPLAGNAYYWLGESYYARSDYTRAAEGFRKGFEANPEGEKAADNLLKLAMSLAQVKRVPEACIVLAQVSTKYGQTNARTATRADAERAKLQCK